MTHKLMLPMASNQGRDYAVTLSEQQDLARRFDLSLSEVRQCIDALRRMMLGGTVEPQKTATKTKKLILAHFENSNVTGRQGA